MVRFFAIFLLVLLALRLVGQVISAFSRRNRVATRAPQEKARRLVLTRCGQCGIHFDPESQLSTAGQGETPFCSPECRRDAESKGREA